MVLDEQRLPEKPQTLPGKTAVVTGATRGIGRAIALELASRGCSVLGTFVSPSSAPLADSLTSTVAALPNDAVFVPLVADTHSPETPALIASTFAASFPDQKLDILVNNAASFGLASVAAETPQHLARSLTGNITTPILLLQALLPFLSTSGSARIINITSEMARVGRANSSAYSAGKAALEGLTRVWAKELGQQFGGLTCNAVAPGLTATDLRENLPQARRRFWDERCLETPVAGRVGESEEVAAAVAWLASAEASWISGAVIPVNGGSTMF